MRSDQDNERRGSMTKETTPKAPQCGGLESHVQSLALQIDIKKRLSELSREELIALRAQYVAATTPALIEHEPEQKS
jgi:hypothetical protein